MSADRDAGQVRLTGEEREELDRSMRGWARDLNVDTEPVHEFIERILAARVDAALVEGALVEGANIGIYMRGEALAARQSDPDATERVEWPGCGSSGNWPIPDVADLPTTVQADRDAGQVRLTDDEKHRLYLILANTRRISIDTCNEIHDRIVAEVETALAARQSDPDATEREVLASALGMCTTFREDVNDGSMCMCGLPALGHDETVRRIMRNDHPELLALLDTLAARQSDPDATEREALAKAWDEGEAAHLHNRRVMHYGTAVDGEGLRINPYRRTVTTGEWEEVE